MNKNQYKGRLKIGDKTIDFVHFEVRNTWEYPSIATIMELTEEEIDCGFNRYPSIFDQHSILSKANIDLWVKNSFLINSPVNTECKLYFDSAKPSEIDVIFVGQNKPDRIIFLSTKKINS